MTIAGHKFYAPIGTGASYIRVSVVSNEDVISRRNKVTVSIQLIRVHHVGCLEWMSTAGAIAARRLSAEQFGSCLRLPCRLHTLIPFAATWQREYVHGRGSGGRICTGL